MRGRLIGRWLRFWWWVIDWDPELDDFGPEGAAAIAWREHVRQAIREHDRKTAPPPAADDDASG